MPRRSAVKNHELFPIAATIAAHSVSEGRGFRQRDVKFFTDLISNWVDFSFDQQELQLQNTQVQRFLDYLTQEGFAHRSRKGGTPTYRLSRIGLIELLSRMVMKTYHAQPAHFFFVHYFIRHFRERISELVRREGKEFPYTLAMELESLLDAQALSQRHLKEVRRMLKRIDQRIADGEASARYVRGQLHKGEAFRDILKEVERRYPYDLNSQRPLEELILSIPPEHQRWELEHGGAARAQDIWHPGRELLRWFERTLREYAKEEASGL